MVRPGLGYLEFPEYLECLGRLCLLCLPLRPEFLGRPYRLWVPAILAALVNQYRLSDRPGLVRRCRLYHLLGLESLVHQCRLSDLGCLANQYPLSDQWVQRRLANLEVPDRLCLLWRL